MLDVQHLIEPVKEPIHSALREIVENSQAVNAILITQDGQHVLSYGNISFINTTALAALVAGMFTATREVAKILGEVEFSIIFQQGQKRNIHISLITRELMLLVVYEGLEKTGEIRLNAAVHGKVIASLMHPPAPAQPEIKSETKTEPKAVPQPQVLQEVPRPAEKPAAQPTPAPVAKTVETKPQPAPVVPDEKFDAFKEYASTLLDDIFGKD